jgi:asparagine synthase (glutamine-hydrolysing)
MCGIIGLFNIQNEKTMRQEALNMVRKIRHRGPDWSGSYSDFSNLCSSPNHYYTRSLLDA